MAIEIKGTTSRRKVTDYFMKCRNCGKIIYFDHDCNGKTVVCPWCGKKH